jgi:hypothetical protein
MTTRHHSCECLNIADDASILSTATILHLSLPLSLFYTIIMERMFLFYTHTEREINSWRVMSTLKVGRLLVSTDCKMNLINYLQSFVERLYVDTLSAAVLVVAVVLTSVLTFNNTVVDAEMKLLLLLLLPSSFILVSNRFYYTTALLL